MPDSPLPLLLQHNQPGRIQVFHLVHERAVELFVLGEDGALFHDLLTGAQEYHLLVQQRRFLDTLASRRMLASADGAAGQPPEFARIERQGSGDWSIAPVTVPPSRVTDHTEMVLAVSAGCSLADGFRLQFGNRDFDSLLLGDELYPEVVRQVRRLRSDDANYPVYLTGVISAEGDLGGQCGLVALLRLKRQFEQRLAAALQRLAQEPG
jgi:adenylate cyclase class 1